MNTHSIAPNTADLIATVTATDASAQAVDKAPTECEVRTRSGALALTSYLSWIPRASSRLRLGLVCGALRRLMRLRVDSAADVPLLRARLLRLDRLLFRMPSWARREPAGIKDIAADWVEAEGCTRERVVLYLHGGAFAFHFPNGFAAFTAHLSRALNARVLLVDYRLAPQHVFPAPQDDCLNAYRALLAQGVPAHRIVVAGDSAGGNLTLSLLQRLVQVGLPQPACAVALSPVTDITLAGSTLRTLSHADPMLPAQSLHVFRDLAFAPEDWADPTASPMQGDFVQSAPVLLMAGTREVLLDDACRFAQRMHESGGRVVFEAWQDMPHVFPLLASLKESQLAIERIADFVADATGRSTVAVCTSEPGGCPISKEIPCLH